MEEKASGSGYLYIIGAIMILIVLGIIFQTTIKNTSTDGANEWKLTDSSDENDNNPENSVKDIDESNTNEETTIFTGGGGGGGSSSSSETTNDQTTTNPPEGGCTTRRIEYGIQNSFKNETCLTEIDNVCTQKQVYCSATLSNDDIITYNFETSLIFVEDGKNKETEGFGYTEESFLISPGEVVFMEGQETITSNGENGTANQVINCFFNTLNNNELEICN